MPRPKTKNELLELSQQNYQILLNFVGSCSEEEKNGSFKTDTLNRNVRDVLAHLHFWHLMMLDWYKIGSNGEKPDMPAKGYTWKTLPDLNKKIWGDSQDFDLKQTQKLLSNSYKKLQKLIISHSDEELFTKKRYKWTGTTSLGAYLISNTSSHYDWAYKLIKKGLR